MTPATYPILRDERYASAGSSALPSSAALSKSGASGSSVLRLISSALPCAYNQLPFLHCGRVRVGGLRFRRNGQFHGGRSVVRLILRIVVRGFLYFRGDDLIAVHWFEYFLPGDRFH